MAVEFSAELWCRAAVHAALADPARLAIVDTRLLVAALWRRHRLPVRPIRPQRLDDVLRSDDLVVAVDHAETFMPEQHAASHAAATRLGREFDGISGMATVERFLRSSYHRFAGRAAVPTSSRCSPNVSPGNGCGPVAPSLSWRSGASTFRASTGKPRTDEIVHAADVVAGMGCGDTCSVLPAHRYEEWVLDDPAGRSLGDVRPIRDKIERRVRRLRTELGTPARAKQPRRW